MALVLDTNINSLLAQNSLTTSGGQLTNSLQQLSSGMRINTSADDAAGYAIAQGMTSQIGGLNQAARNANDGVSLVQTASGSLQEITSDLQTMRNLAVQSLNATNSSTDRADLDTQFQQLKNDINSVSQNTNFNGVNLLDGTFAGAAFQVGANAGQTITVGSVNSVASTQIGANYAVSSAGTTYAASTVAASGTITISTFAGGVTSSATSLPVSVGGTGTGAATDMSAVAAAINAMSSQDGGVIATLAGTAANPTGITLTNTGGGTVSVTTSLTDIQTGLDTTGTVASGGGFATSATPSSYLSGSDVTTVNNANTALAQIDSSLQTIATTGASLGAYQNRFQAAITGLNTTATNLTAARSSIQDTNYAQATSDLSKAQILQQASTAMVAQANTIPQNVLTLLQKLP